MHYIITVSYSFLCNYIGLCLICLTIAVVKCAALVKNDGEMYDNETCTTQTKVYNDTCTVFCTLGYSLTSSDGEHKCTENGNWSNNITCERTSEHAILRTLRLS